MAKKEGGESKAPKRTRSNNILDKLLADKRMRQVFSVVMAILVWLLVAMTISPEKTVTIPDVPIRLDLENLSDDLEVRDGAGTVDVLVTGPRTEVGNLGPNDLDVFAKASENVSVGTYALDLEVNFRDPLINTDEAMSATVGSRKTVNVQFYRINNETFTIEPGLPENFSDFFASEEYYEGTVEVLPGEVTVYGEAEQIERIHRVGLAYEPAMGIGDSVVEYDLPIRFYDEQGGVIDPEAAGLTVGAKTADLRVEILLSKVVPVMVEFYNIPDNFPVQEIPYTLDGNDLIRIAGPKSEIEKQGAITVGPVNLHEIDLDYEVALPVVLPQGFKNIDGVEAVLFRLDPENPKGLIERTGITIKNHTYINRRDEALYEVDFIGRNAVINNVTLIGSESVFEEMNLEEIVFQLNGQNLLVGQREVMVQIVMPRGELVWAVGDYKIAVRVTDLRE